MKGDGKSAQKARVPLFTIDSQNIDAFVPPKVIMGTSVTPRDNIATTADLLQNNFSILLTALQYYGGEKSNRFF